MGTVPAANHIVTPEMQKVSAIDFPISFDALLTKAILLLSFN
jgi:hypothetical protein